MRLSVLVVAVAAAPALAQQALTPAFTYQGVLTTAGSPAGAPVDLRFRLFDAAGGGAQVGATLQASGVAPDQGRFAVSLDFGAAALPGSRRWLEVAVSPAGSGVFTTLTTRQELAATPHATFASTSANASSLNGQAPAFYTNASNLTAGTLADARLSPNIPRLNAATTRYAGDLFAAGALGSDTGALEVRTANQRALSISAPEQLTESPGQFSTGVRWVGGLSINTIPAGAIGSVIAGGGRISTSLGSFPNTVTQPFGFIGGGFGNTVNGFNGTIVGGGGNTAGQQAFVGGGTLNAASGLSSAVLGGENNAAAGAYSIAAGRRAKVPAVGTGSMVFADSTDADFAATAANQFLVRAGGGVGINKNNPTTALDVSGTVTATTFAGSGSLLTGIPIASTTGTLAVARGGTNATAVGPAGSVAVSSGSAFAFTTAGASGQFLRSAGAGTPTWGAIAAGDLPPLAGDVTGSIAATTVANLRGRPIAGAAPAASDVLTWNGSSWTPAALPPPAIPALAGDVTGTLTANTVTSLRGRALANAAPAEGQALVFRAASGGWRPETLQVPTVVNIDETVRLVRGTILSGGGVSRGSGFSSVRNAIGDYTITFNIAFGITPTTVACALDASVPQIVTIASATTTSVRVRVWTIAGAAVDSDFYFTATGSP